MGVKFKDIVEKQVISLDDLSGRVLAVDAHNMLYQFLSNIRNRDGELFTNHRGEVTSHLIGLFSRVSRFLEKNIKLVFVFDGVVPELKRKELKRRADVKKEAQKLYQEALESEDSESARKYAARTSRLTKEMIENVRVLLSAMGIPFVQAPSEGEAQAAYLVSKGDAWAVSSQDYDSLLFGATRLVQNLSIEGKRKIPGKFAYTRVEPQIIDLNEVLSNLKISREKLIWLAILVGTDYNPRGVHRIGPKKGLSLVQKYSSPESLFSEVELADDVSWSDVLDVFNTMPTTDDYNLLWKPVDRDVVFDLLVNRFDFSPERVEKTLDIIASPKNQTSLGDF